MKKHIKNPKLGDIVYFHKDHPGSVKAGKPYQIKEIERDSHNIWVECDDGTCRRGGYELFYTKGLLVSENSKII
jgi:hypothetical protein